MKMFVITELQAQDLEETLKSDNIRPRDLLRCLTTLKTLPQLNTQPQSEPEKENENEKDILPGTKAKKPKDEI